MLHSAVEWAVKWATPCCVMLSLSCCSLRDVKHGNVQLLVVLFVDMWVCLAGARKSLPSQRGHPCGEFVMHLLCLVFVFWTWLICHVQEKSCVFVLEGHFQLGVVFVVCPTHVECVVACDPELCDIYSIWMWSPGHPSSPELYDV